MFITLICIICHDYKSIQLVINILIDTLLQLCDTYPKFLFVPSSVSTSILVGSSKFRSKERLPVLTYLHRNKVLL